jgi:hypothetical protein
VAPRPLDGLRVEVPTVSLTSDSIGKAGGFALASGKAAGLEIAEAVSWIDSKTKVPLQLLHERRQDTP